MTALLNSSTGVPSGQCIGRREGDMVHHLCQFSHESMGTAAESDHTTFEVAHVCHQSVDCLLTDGRIDEVAELGKLLTGQLALLALVNKSEGVDNW